MNTVRNQVKGIRQGTRVEVHGAHTGRTSYDLGGRVNGHLILNHPSCNDQTFVDLDATDVTITRAR